MNTTAVKFLELKKIMDELRSKCPWDQKQTIQSLRTMTIEETYELSDAVLSESWEDIKEELGDLILHVLFYSKIAEEQNKFTIEEVLETIAKKLINRHPHIYGNIIVNDEDDVKKNWEKIKQQEGKKSVLSGVPSSMNALPKALCIQEKVKKVGFEWKHIDDVWMKVEEEMQELKQAIKEQSQIEIEEEFGDVLFSLVNYARFLKVDPEVALDKVNKKFIDRFAKMEAMALVDNKHLADLSLEEMDSLWNSIKKQQRD
ncbi:MAG: nucleoside triphosphate pyrophosphohydrolase [Chitinophagaceae bacterium]|nr:nucleoside triphosphate pyrophosphohydrolase [Chitinophagaceae bacterium]